MFRAGVVAFLVACHSASAVRSPLSLMTTAERSGWLRTGRYGETVQLCRDFARAYSGVTCDQLGRTTEDRPIVALRIERAPGAPYIYVQAGIHAGEIEGKDAGLWFVRDLLEGKVAPGALAAVNLVFVPCINPDGHERFGPNNRPNQRGPQEMGFRTNAQRLNLNRDFMKADSPEIQAVLRVIRTRDPLVFVDLHTTDDAKFEHDIAIDQTPMAARADHLEVAARALSDAIGTRLTALGHLPIGGFYPSFLDNGDPTSGFALNEPPPRLSHGYMSLRGRFGFLVETHSWRTYGERAKSTYHMLQALLELAVTQTSAWTAATHAARAADQRLGGSELGVAFEPGSHSRPIAFRGYHYDIRTSELTGGKWIVYDESRPEVWNVPLRDEVIARVTVHVPQAGYIVDGGYAAIVAPILDRHGVVYRRFEQRPRLAVSAFRATKVTYEPPYEGHTRAVFEGAWAPETRTLDRGAIYVPIAQPLARLAVYLLDPAAPDSLAQWGVFASAFERKEYMEPYVAEAVARDMIAKDPAIQAQFAEAVVANAWPCLRFWLWLHPGPAQRQRDRTDDQHVGDERGPAQRLVVKQRADEHGKHRIDVGVARRNDGAGIAQ